VNPNPPATLRGAVDLPLTPIRYRRTLDDQLAAPTRISPIQLTPAPTPAPRPAATRHGTTNSYARGCRCGDCKAAKSAANGAAKDRQRARGVTR